MVECSASPRVTPLWTYQLFLLSLFSQRYVVKKYYTQPIFWKQICISLLLCILQFLTHQPPYNVIVQNLLLSMCKELTVMCGWLLKITHNCNKWSHSRKPWLEGLKGDFDFTGWNVQAYANFMFPSSCTIVIALVFTEIRLLKYFFILLECNHFLYTGRKSKSNWEKINK